MKNRLHVFTATSLFLAVVLAYSIMAWSYPVAYIMTTYEDLYGEWAQTYSYFLALLLFIALLLQPSRYRWFFVIFALACFYVLMEEISWGQRILGIETPELFKRYNLQQETNIHNLLVGPVSTKTKALMEYAVSAALFLYGVLYPLTLKLNWRIAQWFDHLGFAAPPFYLWPFFLLAAYLELGPFGFNEAEVAELLVGLSLMIWAAHYWFLLHGSNSPNELLILPEKSAALSGFIVLIVSIVVALSATTTMHFYNDPDKGGKIQARILNGYEKFSKRYARYQRWDQSILLLERVHRSEPRRQSIMRKLAVAYDNLGNREKFLEYCQKALDQDLAIYRQNPEKRSTNLSLARTYRLLGQAEKSRFHSDLAFELAVKQVENKPESANSAYWLAKILQFRGNYPQALEGYRRAFELKPGSTKYRRAYYSLLKWAPKTLVNEEELPSASE